MKKQIDHEQDHEGSLRSPLSPRDRQSNTSMIANGDRSHSERIHEETHRAGNLSSRQRSNSGVVSADTSNGGAGTVELPSRAEGHAESSARGAFSKVPLFSCDDLMGAAARALAGSFRKPKRRHSR